MLSAILPFSRLSRVSLFGLGLGLGFMALSLDMARGEERLQLSFPVACTLGETCFLQNLMDMDPGPDAQDHLCGRATYNTHKGIDVRLKSLAAADKGVAVLAAAPGKVKALRDGMTDRLIRTKDDMAGVKGKECGNGILVAHGNGWETQYCHLKKGSIRVKPGDVVRRGTPLGHVGSSGLASFAHLHLTVRRGQQVLDPFTGQAAAGACAVGETRNQLFSANTLWDEEAKIKLSQPHSILLEAGFADIRPTADDAEAGTLQASQPTLTSPSLVGWIRAINLRKGDQISLVVSGPGGVLARHTIKPLKRAKAHYLAYAGKKAPLSGWPAGRYEATFVLLRAQQPIQQIRQAIFLK